MPAGSKKKKKPASNPARAVATTSIQSKSKADTANEIDSTDASGVATPDVAASTNAPTEKVSTDPGKKDGRELHELSPEELEAQLEKSELQQFVEKHASKVRKDAARHTSRLQTDKRLLRGQADFLSVKDWLPEELMQQILEFLRADLDHESQAAKKRNLPRGDDLLAKVWNLKLCLCALEIPTERVDEVIGWVLKNPPSDDSAGQLWGADEVLDWLALQCHDGELGEYDLQRPRPLVRAANDSETEHNLHLRGSAPSDVRDEPHSRQQSADISQPYSEHDVLEVSDLESDLEPDELLSCYLRTKTRLYDVNPANGDIKSKKSEKSAKASVQEARPVSSSERKLQQKLRLIESDVLFDQREADAQWASRKIDLARDAADRKKWRLSEDDAGCHKAKPNISEANGVTQDAERVGQELIEEADENGDDDMLGGMFSALPGVSAEAPNGGLGNGPDQEITVTIRDFGRVTGMSPKRILEESCRSRDSNCKISYQQVSPTTYSCRHSVSITWTKDQDPVSGSYLHSIEVHSELNAMRVTMTAIATPDVAQSEAYVATAAMFLLFSGSPKEERAHFRLPVAFRELWDEFVELKREQSDAADREAVKELRNLIEFNTSSEEGLDDEVIFNASHRFRNGATSGASTPITRPDTPRTGKGPEISQLLVDLWNQKIASQSYQRMLAARMNLPMYHARDTALEAIQRHQVTIVVGDTGSGKSTQLPQFILEHELSQGRQCKIYCTEPRRISAMSLAHRVSEEIGEQRRDLGTARSLVGYAVRLESKIGSHTKLVFATVGIVLRMLENADGLSEVTHLILDEVHERSIDTDFLLIVLRSLLLRRPDLKVVLMSATVDAQKFSQYLDGAPIISVPGRTFPVQAKFLEDAIELTGHTNEDVDKGVVDNDDDIESERYEQVDHTKGLKNYSKRTINTLANYDEYRIDHGLIVKLLEKVAYHAEHQRFSKAILIFLPGIAEIRQLNDMLLGHQSFSQGWHIHALHSSFSSEEQQAAFDIPPNGVRKIVLATNIAETGITIPDVTCVIDTGKHREMRFDERRQMSRLTQSFIARANAKQRRGRAGRVQEGICFHLFTKHRFENFMVDQQTPEMLRLSLQDLVMRVKICKLGDIEQALSQALDPPSSKNIRRAIDALIEVDALTSSEQLTPLGHQLAKLPLDAQLGKLILFGATFGCLDFTLTVAAAVGAKSPFLSPMHAKKQADSVRLGFKRGDSDLLTLYNAYTVWRKVCTTPGLSEYQFCNKNFLSPQNLANIEDLKGQLLTSLVDAGFVSLGPEERAALNRLRPGSKQRNFVLLPSAYSNSDDNDVVATSVVAWSFYPKIVKQEGKGWRNIANNQSLALHPTSVNKTSLPPQVKLLSFYSIMQSSSKFTNAQETSAVSDFALVLLAGDATFHMYSGVIVIDGNRLRFSVRDWRTLLVLKTLRAKLKDVMARLFKHPGRDLGDRQRKWLDTIQRIFEQRTAAYPGHKRIDIHP